MAKAVLIDDVYQHIRTYILEQQQQENMKINQNLLASRLGVSRTPVIKALHMLESEGLVDNIPNRGFFIHVPTIREMSELFMLRQSLEMIAASYACEYGKEQDFQELEDLFAPYIGADIIEYTSYYESDRSFHRKVFDMCDNRLMHRINNSMQILERTFAVGLLRQPRDTLKEHLDIVAAFRARDEARAQDLMHLHTDITRKFMNNADRQLRALGLDPSTLSAKNLIFRNREGESV